MATLVLKTASGVWDSLNLEITHFRTLTETPSVMRAGLQRASAVLSPSLLSELKLGITCEWAGVTSLFPVSVLTPYKIVWWKQAFQTLPRMAVLSVSTGSNEVFTHGCFRLAATPQVAGRWEELANEKFRHKERIRAGDRQIAGNVGMGKFVSVTYRPGRICFDYFWSYSCACLRRAASLAAQHQQDVG